MFTFLLIIQTLVAMTMITLILMQRSEGGGLVGGGSPSGMMSARGASDFLTRSTAILAVVFVALSIVLAALAATQSGPRTIDPSLARQPQAPAQPIPTPGAVPGAAPAAAPGAPAASAPAAPPPAANGAVPLAQ
ncbi:preprotein translocase subunit SecG [Allosphingosinicella sp.]|jgi:preprotein translocase subunit SecG|uniref:preprotein translocase subunit SecG n=1 Tax=Allosphingosinicella sp. TaxID=2823234 RepID=UPI002F0C7F49